MPLKFVRKVARLAFGDGGTVKDRVLRSGIWVGASESVVALLNIARSVFLARLLTPEIFGLMGIANIVMRMFETVSRPGLAQAMIARQKDFAEAAPTAFTMLVVRGLILAIVLAVAAPWVARFYEAEQLEPMLRALAIVFVVGSLANINTIAHQRELNFRKLTYLSQVTSLFGMVITVGAAYWLRSVWALVIGQLVSVSINASLSYYFVQGQIRFGFDREIARDLIRYGKFVTGSSIVLYAAAELDSAVVGKVLGTQQLGFYALAFTIANLVTSNLAKVASSILMPAYSKLQSDLPSLRSAYLRTFSLVMFIVLPATGGLLLLAKPIIGVVYGMQWTPAALPLRILALFGLFRALAALSGYLFEGMGVPKIAFQLGLLRLIVVVALIVPMVREFSLAGAAVTVTIGIAVQWLVGLVYLRKFVGIGVGAVTRALWRPVWTAVVMSAAVATCTLLFEPERVYGLIAAIACGVIVYFLLNFPVLRNLLSDRNA